MTIKQEIKESQNAEREQFSQLLYRKQNNNKKTTYFVAYAGVN